MATLLATIRRLTGAAVGDVSDAEVASTLERNRVRQERLPVVWEYTISGADQTYTRGKITGWGLFEPTDETSASTNTVTVLQSDDSAVTGNWDLYEDGTIIFATDQTSAESHIVVSAYSYDVNAAAAECVDQMLAVVARDYDVKLGDQSFARSQARAGLVELARKLRAAALPSSATLVRVDDVASPTRRRRPANVR